MHWAHVASLLRFRASSRCQTDVLLYSTASISLITKMAASTAQCMYPHRQPHGRTCESPTPVILLLTLWHCKDYTAILASDNLCAEETGCPFLPWYRIRKIHCVWNLNAAIASRSPRQGQGNLTESFLGTFIVKSIISLYPTAWGGSGKAYIPRALQNHYYAQFGNNSSFSNSLALRVGSRRMSCQVLCPSGKKGATVKHRTTQPR